MKMPVCRCPIRLPARLVATLLLFLIPPCFGELLSGSSPPREFFRPIPLLCNVLLYGGGTVLIRELAVRWQLRWSQIFLAIAYGVVEEGLCCKSFFDPNWKDLRGLGNYATAFGVQWAWTLMLITFHMTISTLIPIRMVHMLFPSLREVPLLKQRGVILASLGVVAVTALGYLYFPAKENPFRLSWELTAASVAVVALLGWLAFRLRKIENPFDQLSKSTILNRTPVYILVGFALMTTTIFTPYMMSSFRVLPPFVTTVTQVLILLMLIIFSLATICQREIVVKRDRDFILGCLSYWIVVSFLQGNWMFIVGIATVLFLVLWCILVARAKTNGDTASINTSSAISGC